MDSATPIISVAQQRDQQQRQLISHNRYQLVLASNALLFDIEHFQGHEAISQLYHYRINATCLSQQIQPEQLLQQPAALHCYPASDNGHPAPTKTATPAIPTSIAIIRNDLKRGDRLRSAGLAIVG